MSSIEKLLDVEAKGGVFAHIEQLGHERVLYCHDARSGLKAIIAIHNSTLGPALGGARMWNYASEAAALIDVLRLSRGMTFKSSIAGVNLGGGKSVIIGNAETEKNEQLMQAFGSYVESLGGRYITASDVNTSPTDMAQIRTRTKHVVGLPEAMGGKNPAPATAYGVYLGIKAAVKKCYGKDELKGKRIAIEGVGQVGGHLVEYLTKENAEVTVSDIDPRKIEAMVKQFGVKTVDTHALYGLDVDVYAPCALGASLNDEVIPRLKCAIVAGSANNQLADEERHSHMLDGRHILYAPDFVVNSGGVISVYHEYMEGYSKEQVDRHVETIYDICAKVFAAADSQGITPYAAAMQLAQQRIDKAAKQLSSN